MSAALVGAAFAAAFALAALFAPQFARWDGQAADQLFRLRYRVGGRQRTSPYLIHIVANDSSQQALGVPSWDRSAFGRVLELLADSEARLVVCDVFFRDPGGPGQDEPLSSAARELGRAVLPVLLYPEGPVAGELAKPPEEVLRRAVVHPTVTREGAAPVAGALVAPFAELSRASRALGHINVEPDRDGVSRRVPMLYRWDDGYVPSLSLQAALRYFEVDEGDVEVAFGRHIRLRQARVGDALRRDIVIPIDRHGDLTVNFAGPWADSIQSFPLHKLLDARGAEELSHLLDLLDGALVVISDVTTTNRDYGPGVFESVYPLSGLHVSALNSMLTGEFLRAQPPLERLAVAAALLVLAWLGACRLRGIAFTLAGLALCLLLLAVDYWLFAGLHRVPAVAAPLAALVLTLAAVNSRQLLLAERARLAWRAELAAQKALEQAKVTFAQNVAHELRTPLALIREPLEAMSRRQELPAEIGRGLEQVRVNARRLATLVDQFLDLSKVEAGLAPLRVSRRDLSGFLRAQLTRFEPVAAARGARLQFAGEDGPLPCYFDADKLETIVANLLSNALKSAQTGGLVRLGLKRPDARQMLEITVSDDGLGIPAEELPQLFERFRQGSSSPRGAGSGVGLALVEACVAACRGRIEADSSPGRGARFTVHLPWAAADFRPEEIREQSADERSTEHSAPAEPPAAPPRPQGVPERRRGGFPPEPVLVIDDEPEALRGIAGELARDGIDNLIPCSRGSQGLSILASEAVSAVLLDLGLPDIPGRQVLLRIRDEHPECPVLVVTGLQDVEAAVECIRHGAADYLVKPVPAGRLAASVRRCLEKRELERQLDSLSQRVQSLELKNPEAFAGIVTGSPLMLSKFRYVEAIAESSHPVLITGESGVGKELVARTIHLLSRRSGNFVSENIAGLDDAVVTDTLFGHSRGAFTDANSARRGLVEEAHGGTLFLDEIGDMSVNAQVKLLRFIEDKEFRPLGSDSLKVSDARVILATNVDLARRLQEGRFREDLYYRLTHRIDLPPLRERMGDLPLLVAHFVERNRSDSGRRKPALPTGLLDLLRSYSFPGNVRELKNMIDNALSREDTDTLSLAYFRDYIRANRGNDGHGHSTAAAPGSLAAELPTLKENEERLLAEALRRTGGNQNAAARLLGLSPSALSRRLSKGRRPA